MADWTKFANLLAMAQHGDDFRAAREKKRKEGIEAEELGFRRDANARAASAEGRQSEAFGFEKSNWETKRKMYAAELDAAGLSNQEKKNKLAVFDATGGARGESQRLDEDRLLKQRGAARADRELGLSEAAGKRADRDLQLREKESAVRQTAGERANRIGAATESATIDKQLDAGSIMILNDLQQNYAAAMRAGQLDVAEQIKNEYDSVLREMQVHRASREKYPQFGRAR